MLLLFFAILTSVNQKIIYKFNTLTKIKKLLFSAIALVAFSSVSMGNTITVKKKKLQDESTKTKVALNSNCNSLSFTVYIASRDSGLTVQQSTANANSAYFQCMSVAIPKSISIN